MKQPKALRLADELHGTIKTGYWEAAAELRRLHEVNQELLEACKRFSGVMNLLGFENDPTAEFGRAAIAKATGGQS